ncbi:hypothetical protein GCM10023094_56520 [Rhodococcus olei]|uniref:OB-fold protein n=1 Tax=Rhodococcus olei TaxID=2161675 RepID=A0ABP8PTU5_9NOCA
MAVHDLLEYEEGLAVGELRGPRCLDCERHWWPPRAACIHCRSSRTEWVTLPRVGNLFTWTTVGRTSLPDFRDRTPYAVGIFELPDIGIRLVGHIRAPLYSLHIGMPFTWQVDGSPAAAPPIVWQPHPKEVGGS